MAVVGSLAQSKQINLSKAASIFTRFAASAPATGAGAPAPTMHAKATYLHLVSSAFDELLQLQNDTGLPEKVERKKTGKRSRDERRYRQEKSDDDGVVDSDTKRHRTSK